MRLRFYHDFKVRGTTYVVWAGAGELYAYDSTGAVVGSHSFLSRTDGCDKVWLENLKAAIYGKFNTEIRAAFAEVLLRKEITG